MKKTILIILISILCSFQNKNDIKQKLIGTWKFERFEFPNYIQAESKQVKDANKANKGLEITFTIDNKFISKQINGRSENNTRITYKLLKDNKHLVIGSDTTEIDKIDEKTLVLYAENRPTILFIKKQAKANKRFGVMLVY